MGNKTQSWKRRWRLWRLGAVKRYYFESYHNKTHPFEDLGDGFFYITVRSDKFAFGVGVIISAITLFTLFCVFVDFFSFPLALFIVVIAYAIFSMYGHLSTKELIISRHGGYIMRVKGTNKILLEEPVHNCYIKLQRKYDSLRQPHFYLILGGFELDDIRISGMADQDTTLRILGSNLAETMGINYFDYDNNSTLHRIIHYPGFSTLRATDREYYQFLQEHFVSKTDLTAAMSRDSIPEGSALLPAAISHQIVENYKEGVRITKQNIKHKHTTFSVPETKNVRKHSRSKKL